jgi:hypothetical protein
MQNVCLRKIFGMAVGLLLSTGCGGSGSGVPSSAPAPQIPLSHARGDANAINLSGQYTGTVGDSSNSLGATLDLAQYQTAVGGTFTIAIGSGVTDIVSWNANGSTLTGTLVQTSDPCVFTTTATYDSAKRKLSGSFAPVHGCASSAGGRYSFKHTCEYKSGGNEDVRPDNGPHPC